MTEQEAIQVLNNYKLSNRCQLLDQALEIAINALNQKDSKYPIMHIVTEKESPIEIDKISFYKGTSVHKCPNCYQWVSKKDRFCPECGQSLNWSCYN